MILIFGGTTEGRKAIKEIEEAGKPFYYSTKTGEQEVELCHGEAIFGAMTKEKMIEFCCSKNIRMLVDAAHPFASHLHQTVADVAACLDIPAIRFERIFPPRDNNIIWCDSYAEAVGKIESESVVIATTGVQSIAHLKALEDKGCKVYYQILNRQSSIEIANAEGISDDRLIYYDSESPSWIGKDADYIIMKESGLTGGYQDKVKEAQRKGMRIIALRRPTLPEGFYTVNGEHGLRRMIEKLLPEFYPLRSGLTTGTYATAAAIAAYNDLMGGNREETVPVILPNGETILVEVHYADGYAYVIKESGDDPDVTNCAEIRAKVEATDGPLTIVGGKGVGHFTIPGFDYPPGEAAINRVPREMIRHNLNNANVRVTISVVDGERMGLRTFNPRLGIEGGISIVGVSGIIKPFSEEAFIDSIRKCVTVAVASGCGEMVINSGAKSERMVRSRFPSLPPQCFVEYGNYIGATLSIASELSIPHVHLVMMIGKAVKLAAGHLDTHSRRSTMDRNFIASMLAEAGCSEDIIGRAHSITLARELWDIVPQQKIDNFIDVLRSHCHAVCDHIMTKEQLEIIILKDE